MALDRTGVKRLAREILDRGPSNIPLQKAPDRFAAEGLRRHLEALGADVVVDEVETDAP